MSSSGTMKAGEERLRIRVKRQGLKARNYSARGKAPGMIIPHHSSRSSAEGAKQVYSRSSQMTVLFVPGLQPLIYGMGRNRLPGAAPRAVLLRGFAPEQSHPE